MKETLRQEWQRWKTPLQSLDKQTAFVLIACVILVFGQLTMGSRGFFEQYFGGWGTGQQHELYGWAWWFGIQGVSGFIIPVLCLLIFFKRKPSEIGLGLGDWKLASTLAGLYLPLVVIGTWFLSNGPSFKAVYPHFQGAAHDWRLFAVYELLFLFYWFGWEYLWRGFVLFGTRHTLGYWAIFVQMIPFAILHAEKPIAEAFLSILGGLALGALCWRCRSFWIAVPIHAAQMLILDFWCTLRIRTGVQGVGLDALLKLFGW